MSLKERWEESRNILSNGFQKRKFEVIGEEMICVELDKLAREAMIEGSEESLILEPYINNKLSTLKSLDESPINRIAKSYLALCEERQFYQNKYIQDHRADLVDRWRYLGFRIATAIGIAAVILTTGYLANRWGIPLPLSRFAS